MSVLGQILGRPTPGPSPARAGADGLKGGETRDGEWWRVALNSFIYGDTSEVSVTPESAITSAAVYACVRILAETLASLPLITYKKRLDGGRERATDFYLYPILHDEPNEWMTSFEFRETLQGHLALWGNAFCQVEYGAGGQVRSLFPLRPDRMKEIRVENGQKSYKYELPNGEPTWLPGDIVWHLKAFGDGTWGYSPVGLMKRSIGLSLSMEKFGSKFFSNGARPGGVLEHPGKLGAEASKNVRTSWNEAHMGLENSHKVAILEEGLKWHEIGMPLEEAQFLESRKFQATEIARMYRVPPHMIADLDRATFSNIEQQSLEFVTYTMTPWLVRWEQSIKKNLMVKAERKIYYAEFLLDGLLRGDTPGRTAYYSAGKQWGWLSTNDIREKENMNPVEGGDEYMVPLNMVAAGSEPTPPANNSGASSPSLKGGEEQKSELTAELQRTLINTETLKRIEILKEQRARDSARSRHRLMGAYRGLYQDTAARVLRREAKDVSKAVKRIMPETGFPGVRLWMEEFYREHVDYVIDAFAPVSRTYGALVADQAAKEVEGDTPEDSVERFTESYVGGYGARHVAISKSKVEQAYSRAIQDELDAEEAMLQELEAWPETRAASVANEESVRFNNAMAKMVYGALGVQFLRSVAFGENCPYCDSLDGVVVGINEFFIKAGSEIAPEGVEPLRSSSDIGHPPFHDSCDCCIISA